MKMCWSLVYLWFLILQNGICYFKKDLTKEQWFLINNTIALPTKVPASVYTTLLKHNIIKDPYIGFRDVEYSWIADQDWVYQTTFNSKILKLLWCY